MSGFQFVAPEVRVRKESSAERIMLADACGLLRRTNSFPFRGFDREGEAVEYARLSGWPLGKLRPDPKLATLGLRPFFVGQFSPFHYSEVEVKDRI